MDAIILCKAVEGGGDQAGGYGEEFGGFLNEVVLGGVGMAVVRHFVEGVDDAGFEAGGVVSGEAEGLGDFVGGFEAHAENVPREAVRVGLDDLKGFRAVGFIDFDGEVGGDTVPVQEEHDVFDLFLFHPGGSNLGRALGADVGDFAQAFGFVFDDVEGVRAKGGDDAVGEFGANAFDEAGAKIAANGIYGGGEGLLADFDLELVAVFGVVGVVALEFDVFARGQLGEVADEGDQPFAVHAVRGEGGPAAVGFEPDDAVAVFGVVVGDALDGAGEGVHKGEGEWDADFGDLMDMRGWILTQRRVGKRREHKRLILELPESCFPVSLLTTLKI